MEEAAIETAVETGLLLRDGVIILGAALVFVTLFRRLGLGAILGYLLAGALLGPELLGIVDNPEAILRIADLGIVLLLFLVGLELHPARLWRLKQDIFGLGLLQVVVSGLAIAALVYFVTGLSPAASLAIGLPLGLSSTAQVLPSLRSSGEINTRPGERAFSILLLQDLAIVPMLIIVTALSRAEPDPAAPGGWLLAFYGLAAIAGLVLAGRYLINPLFRIIGRVSERELFVVAGLFTVFAAAAVMESLHLSMALGAFIAGVMLADSPYRHELETDIDPFRSILLGLFFVAIGMMLDLGAIASRPVFVIGMAIGLIAVKAAILFGLARSFGMPSRGSLKLGLLLSQGGEFGFVLFAEAQRALLIAPEAASLFGAVVTLSMASTPFLMKFNDRLDRRSAARAAMAGDLDGPEKSGASDVIVIGYGRFGQTVAQMLIAHGAAVTLIDSKPAQIETSDSFGMKVYYGDGTRVDLLRQAGAGNARLILFCQDERMAQKRLEIILEAFPQASVFVRAYDRRDVMAYAPLDLALVVREVFESAVLMGRGALSALGVEEDELDRIVRAYRDRDEERLAGQSKTGDLHTLKNRMFRPGGEPLGETEGQPG